MPKRPCPSGTDEQTEVVGDLDAADEAALDL